MYGRCPRVRPEEGGRSSRHENRWAQPFPRTGGTLSVHAGNATGRGPARQRRSRPPGSAGRAAAQYVYKDGKESDELDKVHLRVYCSSPDGKELSGHAVRQLRNLALHEFGHALGLAHSPNGLDIMYWKSGADRLSDRDRRTILRLYGCKDQ